MPYSDQVVLFECIYPGDSCFFFNAMEGSIYKVCVRELPYDLCDMASTVNHISPIWPDNIVEVTNIDEVSSMSCVYFCSVSMLQWHLSSMSRRHQVI